MVGEIIDCEEYGLPGQVFVDWRTPASGRYEKNGIENLFLHGDKNDTFILRKRRIWNIERLKDARLEVIARVNHSGLTELPLNMPHAWEPDEILIYCPEKCKPRLHVYYEPCINASGIYEAESNLNEERNCSRESEGNRTHEQDCWDENKCVVCSEETADVWRPMTYKLGEWTLKVDPIYLVWIFGRTTTHQTEESIGNVLGYHPPAPCPDRLSTSKWLIYDSQAKDLLPGKNSLHIFEPDTCGCGDRSTNYSYFYYAPESRGFYSYKDNDTWVHESDIQSSIILKDKAWVLEEDNRLYAISNATACLENIKDKEHKFYCEQDLYVSSRVVVTENGVNTTLFKDSPINHRPSYTLSGTVVLQHEISHSTSKKAFWVLYGVCTKACKPPNCKVKFPSWNFRPYTLKKKGCTIVEDCQGEMVKISTK
ncbi:uncharacterized protein LOC143040693 isoform X2 [Oratosquilla oratoria]